MSYQLTIARIRKQHIVDENKKQCRFHDLSMNQKYLNQGAKTTIYKTTMHQGPIIGCSKTKETDILRKLLGNKRYDWQQIKII